MIGCKSSSKQLTTQNDHTGNEVIKQQILFVNVLLKKETDATVSASMVNYKWRDGQLKLRPYHDEASPEVLYIQLLDANQKVLKEIEEPNPLYRSVELFEPGGSISRQEIEIEETYLSIRVQAPVNVKYLNIVSKTGNYTYLLELL